MSGSDDVRRVATYGRWKVYSLGDPMRTFARFIISNGDPHDLYPEDWRTAFFSLLDACSEAMRMERVDKANGR